MPDSPEPLAAILAEIRAFALRAAEEDKMISPEFVLLLADKVDAAAERERDEDRQLAAIAESDEAFARCARCDRPERTHGNAAAMRDALEEISARIKQEIEQPIPGNDPTGGIAMCEMEVIANAALSAQARNCDRFRTLDEARKAFEAEHSQGIVRNLYTEAFGWLFAPAKEGGAE